MQIFVITNTFNQSFYLFLLGLTSLYYTFNSCHISLFVCMFPRLRGNREHQERGESPKVYQTLTIKTVLTVQKLVLNQNQMTPVNIIPPQM